MPAQEDHVPGNNRVWQGRACTTRVIVRSWDKDVRNHHDSRVPSTAAGAIKLPSTPRDRIDAPGTRRASSSDCTCP